MTQKKEDSLDKTIRKAVQDREIPKIYANGFINAVGQGDMLIVLQQNGEAAAVLNLSYTVAKSLALKLGGLVKNLERNTGNTIMTTDDITAKLGKKGKGDKATNETIQ